MAKARHDRISALIKDVEGVAKRLRADVRKTAAAAPKTLEKAANELRKRAAAAAGQVEKYVHELRRDLERGMKKPVKKAKARPKSKPAPAM